MLKSLKKDLEKKMSEKAYIEKDLKRLKKERKLVLIELKTAEKALLFIQDTALDTQRQLEFHINEMVTAGLNSVSDENLDFVTEFELKRENTECKLRFEKDGNPVDPLLYSGLGMADVAAFCLRAASISMNKKIPPILILDEPFKHLDTDHHESAGKLVQKISKSLGIQIIMVTHSRKFTEYADRVFKVTQRKGISQVSVL